MGLKSTLAAQHSLRKEKNTTEKLNPVFHNPTVIRRWNEFN
jgi:hypothetical protein